MKKVAATLGAMLLSSSAAFAGSAVIAPNYFDGFYVGAGGGVQANQADVSGSTNTLPFTPIDVLGGTNTFSGNLADTSAVGNLMAGYGMVVRDTPLYLGGEIGLNFSDFNAGLRTSEGTSIPADFLAPGSPEIGIGNTNTNTVAKMNTTEFTIDFRPGVLVSERSMLYGLVGAAFNRAKLSTDVNYTIIDGLDGLDDTRVDASNEHKKSVTGLRLGFGIETIVGEYWSVGLRYIWTRYNTVNVSACGFNDLFPDEPTPVGPSVQTDAKFRPSKHSTMLTVSRYFN